MLRAPFSPDDSTGRGKGGAFIGSRLPPCDEGPAKHFRFPSWHGARRLPDGPTTGFTLLEMCIVLVIIALMIGVSMPAIQTAYTERAVRDDSHQLALMVKTAMIQSAEQNRPYVIDLAKDTIALHPQGDPAAQADSSDAADSLFNNAPDDQTAPNVVVDVKSTDTLDAKNRLQIPDPVKANAWVDMPDNSQWVFQPGELCPATRVRMTRGDSWLEMGFAALTGNVENEATYFP